MSSDSTEGIENVILLIRGRKVMLSPHLASLYGVQPRILMQVVRRNLERFPSDFMFALTSEELNSLRSQNVILEKSGKSALLGTKSHLLFN